MIMLVISHGEKVQNFFEAVGPFQPHNGHPHHGVYVELVQHPVLLHLHLLQIEYVHLELLGEVHLEHLQLAQLQDHFMLD